MIKNFILCGSRISLPLQYYSLKKILIAKSETRNFSVRKEERLTIDNDMNMVAYMACCYFYAPDVETLPRDNNNNVAK